MTEKAYSDVEESYMIEVYTANPSRETVEDIAEELNKKVRSVIAKLSSLGVYVVPPKTNKAGQPIVKKEQLVERIENATGLSLPTLAKANKSCLQRLANHLDAE